jgi:hypothetical protein
VLVVVVVVVMVIICGEKFIPLSQVTYNILVGRQHFWNVTDFRNFGFGFIFC